MIECNAKTLRMYLELTQKELARLAKVPSKDVSLLEHGQLPLAEKRRILSLLYAEKAKRWN